MSSPYSRLPAVSALLGAPELAGLPHPLVVEALRGEIAVARAAIAGGAEAPPPAEIAARAAASVRVSLEGEPLPVLNLTGVVLHTNLGRAPLHPVAAAAVAAVAEGYSAVELRLETGRRGGRQDAIRAHLRALVGAEDALVVNNGAAALLLALTALAAGREVLCSRGELVEIGGSFRVPDIITVGGARLREVGTTNRTRVADYAAACGPESALLLRVHPSNFRQVGFVERAARADLVALGAARGLPVVEDLGSGLIGEPPRSGVGLDEERVERALAAGVDLVCFSGDKLLGGPQAGILCGRPDLIARLRAHPMARALRADKLCLAALEATLRLYRAGRSAEIPARAMLAAGESSLHEVAARIAAGVPGAVVVPGDGASGGGALPGEGLPGWLVRLPGGDADALAARLRHGRPAVVGRVVDGAVCLDPRTLLPGQEALLAAALSRALAGVSAPR